MIGTLIGFGIWCITGCFFIALGIYLFFSKEVIGFWANIKRNNEQINLNLGGRNESLSYESNIKAWG